MAKMVTDSQHYADIADAIREKAGTSESLRPADMAAAIATIPTGGSGEDQLPAFLDGTMTELNDATITTVRPYACYAYTGFTSVNLPRATSIGKNAFENCTDLRTVIMP